MKSNLLTSHQKWVLGEVINGATIFCNHVVCEHSYQAVLIFKDGGEIGIKQSTIESLDKKGVFEWDKVMSNNHLCGWRLRIKEEEVKLLIEKE